jgi:hypothetical protein
MKSTSVRKLTSTELNEGKKVSIHQEMMGLSPAIPGPVFLLHPTREERTLFLKEFGSQLKTDDEIFAIIGYVQAEEVRDIRGRRLLAFAGLPGKAALFFVDRNPSAKWGHECWYVLYLLSENRFVKTEHHAPLPDEVELFSITAQIPRQLTPQEEFDAIDEKIEAIYQEIFAQIALREDGLVNEALEAKIEAKRQELADSKKARAQAAQKILEAPSALDEWRKDVEEAKQLLKEHHETASDHSATNKGAEQKTQP